MNQTNHAHEDLRVIKKMMEQSTKFLSLSGLSGVAAGMVALLGAAAAWWKLDQQPSSAKLPYFYTHFAYYGFYICITLLVLALSVGLALYFSYRKSKQHSLPFWSPVAAKLLFSLLTILSTSARYAQPSLNMSDKFILSFAATSIGLVISAIAYWYTDVYDHFIKAAKKKEDKAKKHFYSLNKQIKENKYEN